MNSSSVQEPIPSRGSGEILGAKKVPNGDFKARPPPRSVSSGCLGIAWHDGQPPARKRRPYGLERVEVLRLAPRFRRFLAELCRPRGDVGLVLECLGGRIIVAARDRAPVRAGGK